MENNLPKNWVETELGNFAFLKNGYAYKTTQFTDSGIPILKISNITKDGKVDISNPQYVNENDLNKSFLVNKGDIVIAMSGATTGKFGIYDSEELLLQNQRVGNLKLQSDNLGNKRFLYYLIAFSKKEIEEKAYGGAQPNISPTLIEEIKIPLPPLPEQERIVAKLDALFAQQELMKKALTRIPQLLKDFRQQVLTQAVTGKLTKHWRVGKELEEWKVEKLKNICSRITVGFVGKTVDKYRESGIPFLRSQNIRAFRYDSENLMFIDNDFHTQIKKSSISADDVAIVRSGYPGTTCVIPKEIKIANCSDILVLTTKPDILNPHFVAIFMNSQKGKEIVLEGKVGMAQQHFNTKKLQDTYLTLPPILEQQEIVSCVESLFAKADAIENRYKTLKTKIESLPQALLHKAFKGELVAQLPTDGDAKDLLAEIIKLKEEANPKKGKKKTTK